MQISIISTLYQSSAYIEEFCHRVSAEASKLVDHDYEIILVNDGSPDNSLEIAAQVVKKDSKVSIIDLSRNFGHHKAMMTGLSYAKGQKVFLIDIDLEEEPEWLTRFDHIMQEQSSDVVYGVQTKRKGNLFERWSGQWFYTFFQLFTGLALPRNIVTARLMTRRYVDALLSHRERELFLAGLWHTTGFKQVPCPIKKHSTSQSTYTLRKKIALLVNSVTSFSNIPLISIFYIGFFISFLACTYTAYLIINWMFFSTPLSGWTSLMASIWLVGGMLISFIGIVGVYLSKIYSETKQRPYTIVREVYGRQE